MAARFAGGSELRVNPGDPPHLQVLRQTMEIASPAPGIAKQDLKNNISHPWSMAGEEPGAKCLMKSQLLARPPKPSKLPQSVWDGTKSSISYFNSHLRKQERAQKHAAGENNCQLPSVKRVRGGRTGATSRELSTASAPKGVSWTP